MTSSLARRRVSNLPSGTEYAGTSTTDTIMLRGASDSLRVSTLVCSEASGPPARNSLMSALGVNLNRMAQHYGTQAAGSQDPDDRTTPAGHKLRGPESRS